MVYKVMRYGCLCGYADSESIRDAAVFYLGNLIDEHLLDNNIHCAMFCANMVDQIQYNPYLREHTIVQMLEDCGFGVIRRQDRSIAS